MKQVEELRRSVILVPGALLQPLLVGVGQWAVRTAEAEDGGTQGRRLAGNFLQALHLAGGEGGCQRAAQAQGFLAGGAALAERRRVGTLPLQQQQGLEELEGLRRFAQPPAQRLSGLPAWGCHVRTSLSASTSTVRTKRLALA
ncbi:hypothetical protein D3C78_1204170 [compost metagenome]